MGNWLSNNAKIHKEDKFDSGSTGLIQAALGSLEDMGLGGVIAGVAQMSVDEGGFLFTAGAKTLSICISRNVNLGLTTDTVTCTKTLPKTFKFTPLSSQAPKREGSGSIARHDHKPSEKCCEPHLFNPVAHIHSRALLEYTRGAQAITVKRDMKN